MKSLPRWALTGTMLTLALFLGQCWLSRHDAERDKVAALRAGDVVADAVADTAQRLAAHYADQRQRDSVTIMSLNASIVSDSILYDSLKTAGVVRYIELRGALEPSLRPLLDSLQSAHMLAVAAQDSIIGSLHGVVAILEAERLVSDSLLQTQGRALIDALAQRDGWKHRASPGIIEQARRGLPWMAAGALLVLVLRR